MTATPTRRAPTKSRRRDRPRSPLSGWVVGGLVAAVIAVAGIVAVVATAGSDHSTDGLEQTRPVAITGTALPAFTDNPADPAIGMTAPTLTGAGFDGAPLAVEPGAPTLVVFLAHWCPHCQREVPVLADWAADGGVPAGVQVIGVATSTTSERPNYPPSAWLEREHFPFPVIADSPVYDAATAYGLTSYPYFVVLDSSGRVTTRASGEIDPDALTTMLASLT